jgi:hypothetical protein
MRLWAVYRKSLKSRKSLMPAGKMRKLVSMSWLLLRRVISSLRA